MNKGIIEQLWLGYRQHVIPADAPQAQFDECSKAFYAGAMALFYRLLQDLCPGSEPTAKDLKLLDEIQREFVDYNASVLSEIGGAQA